MKHTVAEVISFLSKHPHDAVVTVSNSGLVVHVPSKPRNFGVVGDVQVDLRKVTPLVPKPNVENIPHMLRDLAQEFDEGKNESTLVIVTEIRPDGSSCSREFGHEFSQHDNTRIGALFYAATKLAKRAGDYNDTEDDKD